MLKLRTFSVAAVGILSLINEGSCASLTIEKMGDILNYALPAYAAGMTIRDDDYSGIRQLAYSWTATQITISELQKAVAEPRPNGGKNGFPSGHAGSAFSGATFIHKRYGYKKAIVPYILAGFVGYSRVQARWHYAHDVLAGAAIAGLYTWAFVDSESTIVSVSADTSGARLDFNVKF